MPDLLKYGFSGKLTGNLQLGDKDHSFRYINPLTSDHKPEVTSCGSFELPARLYRLQVFQELWMRIGCSYAVFPQEVAGKVLAVQLYVASCRMGFVYSNGTRRACYATSRSHGQKISAVSAGFDSCV